MAISAEPAEKLARKLEQQLKSKSTDQRAANAAILSLLQEYRNECERIVHAEFGHAFEHHVEPHLWDAHGKVNTYFRKQLSVLNKDGRTKAVETRIVQKQYLEFIKSSQRFYRQYILYLDKAFGGTPELRELAKKWKSDLPQAEPTQALSPELQALIRPSIYQAVIQLGDLSRYRELQRSESQRNWSYAIGYYSLAFKINPDSGISHNQLAVVALADGDHFRAVYNLYRSLAAKEPHPMAKGNLELEFKKVIAAWDRGELIGRQTSGQGNGAYRALKAWFVRLHSKCYRGEDFAGHDELENEVLSQLGVELKERSLEGLLQKFVLVNTAAEYYAFVKLQAGETTRERIRAYFFFLRFNIKTFNILLQILQAELERLTGEDLDGSDSQPLSEKVTAVARRVLPGIRLYSTWFMKNWSVLSADLEGSAHSKVDAQELWKAYAETLTLLASAFHVSLLPMEQYLLEEDVETLGFQPLLADNTKRRWFDGSSPKAKWSDEDVKRNHPNDEMLMRIRDLLVDGLELVQDKESPIVLDCLRFVYQEDGIPSQLLASPSNNAETAVPIESPHIDIPGGAGPINDDQVSHAAPSETASNAMSKDAAMNRMVDDLLGPEDGLEPLPEEDENIPPTPPEQTFEDTALINDGSYGITPLTATDYVNMVRNYSQASCTPDRMHRNSTASPAVQHFPSLPSLPDHSGIWNKNYSMTSHNTPAVPPGLNVGSSAGHSRNGSMNASWSSMPNGQVRKSSPPHGTSFSYDVTLPGISQVYGNIGDVASGHLIGQQLQVSHEMRGPMAFGQGVWGADGAGRSASRHRGSYVDTAPNGQGG
ncbi:hypothetical protein BKA80DRAFT_314064 [Phyllosticta citrichinensis]